MSMRRLGISNYHLALRRDLQSCADVKAGRVMMELFKDDPAAIRELRKMIIESGPSPGILEDVQVLETMAHLLAKGELILVRDYPMQGGNAVTSGKSSESDAPPPSAPVSTAKTSAPEDPTFPPDSDGASQASNLQNAAQTGQPFVSQCKFGNCSGCGKSGSC
jgi:hypothetical protein